MNFQIELTNHCNLKCVECPHRMMKRKKQFMEDEVMYNIIGNYIEDFKPLTVIMHKDGEPLMHPKIFEFMKVVDDRLRVKFDLYTNGHLLKPEHMDFFKTLRSKVWVLVSFHFYDYLGKDIDYSNVNVNIEVALKHCPDNVEFVFATHSTDFADDSVLQYWREAWLNKGYGRLRDVHVNPHINPWTGLIEQSNTIQFDACPYGDGQHMFFGVTGNIIACCMDLEEEIVFGNIMTDTKTHIMQQRDAFYKCLRENDIGAEVCKRCLS